jgi:PAS domain S-box-containing protein
MLSGLSLVLAGTTIALGIVAAALASRLHGAHRSERHFRGLVESAPDAMILVDAAGRIAFVNSRAAELFGYARSELLGSAVEMLVPSAVRGRHPVLRAGYGESPRVRPMGQGLALAGQRKDGTELPVEISLSPLATPDGTFFCAVVRDVTERRAGERAVRDAREFAERIIETIPDGMIVADASGSMLVVNARTEELFGYDRSELLGRPVEMLVPRGARGRHPAMRRDYADEPRVRPMGAGVELSGERKDGTEIPVEISLSPIGAETGALVCAVVRDVTERRRQDVAVREARAFAESIVDTIREPLVVLDRDLCVLAANGAFQRAFEIAAVDVVGRSLFAPGAVRWATPELRRRLADVVTTGQELADLEVRYESPTAGPRTLEIDARPIKRPGGPAQQILVAIEDVTERRRAEQYLFEREALKRTNRELQEFAYVASHDLQEPLRKIQAFGDRLGTAYAEHLPSEAADYVARMQNAANRMGRLLEDLLAFSRVTTGAQTFAPVDLDAVAREVVSDLEIRLEQTAGRIDIGPLPVVEGDASQLRQLLQNLLANALKFHRPGVPPTVTVRARTTPTACRIEIADDGIGFDEKYLDRIFTIFQRLHSRSEFEGTGVGLAICRKVVERHRGDITARSTPGAGSTFVVTLPIRQTNPLRAEDDHAECHDGRAVAHGG